MLDTIQDYTIFGYRTTFNHMKTYLEFCKIFERKKAAEEDMDDNEMPRLTKFKSQLKLLLLTSLALDKQTVKGLISMIRGGDNLNEIVETSKKLVKGIIKHHIDEDYLPEIDIELAFIVSKQVESRSIKLELTENLETLKSKVKHYEGLICAENNSKTV